MNILLWILQILLALHTTMGALWKFSTSEKTIPSLSAIPHEAWLAMSALELLCSLGLIVPAFNKRLGILAPIAAALITAEMVLFCGLHILSGSSEFNKVIYWMIVAAICSFIAYGRFVRKPITK